MLAALPLLLALFSCSTVAPGGEFGSLHNQGLLGVSSTSPTVGANLFLSRELENSQNLRRFFEDSGAPVAIELKGRILQGEELLMFYLPNRVFSASRAPEPQTNEWIIRGPRSISREQFNDLRSLAESEGPEAIFEVFARVQRYELGGRSTGLDITSSRALANKGAMVEPEIPHIPMRKPAPRPKPTAAPSPTQGSGETPQIKLPSQPANKLDPKDYMSLNLNQRAILISQGYAPRADSGDLLHRVQSDQETLEKIAAWYTGNADNITQIAVANNLAVDAKLEVGRAILVPIGLVTEYKQMGK
jgi:hypothetical protein